MKYLAKSQNNKMVQVGEDVKKGKWFYVTEETAKVVDSLVIGDTVTFVSEPRGGALYITFLSKGEVAVPSSATKIQETIATQTPKPAPSASTWKKNTGSDMTKSDWEEKGHRDFKGRSIAYASSAMTLLYGSGPSPLDKEQYLRQLFEIAKSIEEYIYS